MASQISHVVYTKNYFEALASGKLFENLTDEEKKAYPLGNIDRDEFMIGSVFPDIRRIDFSIKRNYTHMYFPRINLDFSGLSAFEAGWKFHLWCDMKREEILNGNSFYDLGGADDFGGLAAKILEDELVYDNYNNWEKLCAYLNQPPFFAAFSKVSKESYGLWYAILAKYMEKKPDDQSMKIFLLKQPSNAPRADEIIASIQKLRRNKKVTELLFNIQREIF